jgi:hypothetical protein
MPFHMNVRELLYFLTRGNLKSSDPARLGLPFLLAILWDRWQRARWLGCCTTLHEVDASESESEREMGS